MAQEMAVLRGGLRCNAVAVFGSEPDRFREGAEIALRAGLRTRLQPRPIDADAATLCAVTAEVAAVAEDLRQEYGPIGRDLGVKWTIFSTGINPGATLTEIASADQQD